jgi:hypothetical protein
MKGCSIAAAVDTLDPTEVVRLESESESVECSTVAFSLFSTFEQPLSLVASKGYCLSCGKPPFADALAKCLVRIKQNLSFVIIPLKIACTDGEM